MSSLANPSPLVVIKVGGDVLLNDAQREGLAANVVDLVGSGARVVVLHGGGPQVTALQQRLGLKTKKVAGQRVTSVDDLAVVVQAICGEVNVGLTCLLLRAGVRAFGLHGASGGVVQARRRPPVRVAHEGELVDYGEVGDVTHIDAALILHLVDAKLVPVIATLGVDPAAGRPLNINADTTAARLAQALHADLLLLVTAVGGVFRSLGDPDSRIDTLTPTSARQLIEAGVIQAGMIPKVEEALSLLDTGVGRVAILDAAQRGAFSSAVNGDGERGTVFRSDSRL